MPRWAASSAVGFGRRSTPCTSRAAAHGAQSGWVHASHGLRRTVGEGSGVREPHTVSSSSETAPSSELCAFTTGGSAAPSVALSAFTSAILEENARGDAVQRFPRVGTGRRALASWHTGITRADGRVSSERRRGSIREAKQGKARPGQCRSRYAPRARAPHTQRAQWRMWPRRPALALGTSHTTPSE